LQLAASFMRQGSDAEVRAEWAARREALAAQFKTGKKRAAAAQQGGKSPGGKLQRRR
jgi:hypothetical protein